MLAENLENLVKKERLQGIEQGMQQGIQQGVQQGIQQGRVDAMRDTARNLIAMNLLGDEQIAQASGLTLQDIAELKAKSQH